MSNGGKRNKKHSKPMETIAIAQMRKVSKAERQQMVRRLMRQGLTADEICRWLWREHFIWAPIETLRDDMAELEAKPADPTRLADPTRALDTIDFDD